MAVITINQVTARISKNANLQDINLSIGPDEHWAIVGANGSGKSALGNLLCGNLEVTSGTLKTLEKSAYVSFEKVTEILEVERYNDDSEFLGTIDQGTKVRDFILGAPCTDEKNLLALAALMDFTHLLDRGIRFLSTGEMRKIVICKALQQAPELLVLDEPFDGLDVKSHAILQKLIAECMKNGVKIVLLLNRFSEILPQITHVAYVKECRIFISGAKENLLKSEALLRLHAFSYCLPKQLPETDSTLLAPPLPKGVPLIVMNDVVVRYDNRYILKDFSWTVQPGEHWKISGPNGAGKSTLLSLVSGDNPQAYANDILLFGRKRGTGESIWEIKKQIGLVSTSLQQNYRVGGTAKVVVLSGLFDSIGVYTKYTRTQEKIALKWLEILQMKKDGNTPFLRLSYGEQRLVLLARAMVKQPPLLILDEPCQGLDELNRAMVLKLIDHLAQTGKTQILYVSHHPEDGIPSIKKSLELVPAPGGGYTGLTTPR